jgi:hypothetical protein
MLTTVDQESSAASLSSFVLGRFLHSIRSRGITASYSITYHGSTQKSEEQGRPMTANPEFFNPKDFITAPYRSCPGCAQETFGVFAIKSDHYSRACRACGHRADYRLPPLHRKIIYLDQFVISNLMKLLTPETRGHEKVKEDEYWRELYDILVGLRHLQAIACPFSEAHEQESLTFEFGDALKRLYEELGSGNWFKHFDKIKALQIVELARAWSDEREPAFTFDPSSVLGREPHRWNERFYLTSQNNPFLNAKDLRRRRDAIHDTIAQLFTDLWREEKHDFFYWYDRERNGYQTSLHRSMVQARERRIDALAHTVHGHTVTPALLGAVLPRFAETLYQSINQVFRFRPDRTQRTEEEWLAVSNSFGAVNRIAEAPFVRLSSMMYAALAMRAANGQKTPPDTGIRTDIDIVAHLMPYCDAMFIDDKCRSLLLDTPKKLRPAKTSNLFSSNTRQAFLLYLRGIYQEVPQTQLEIVREIYGTMDR